MAGIAESVGNLSVQQATELKRGGLYALKFNGCLSPQAEEGLDHALKGVEEQFGIRFILFDDNLEIVEPSEVEALIARAIAKHFEHQ